MIARIVQTIIFSAWGEKIRNFNHQLSRKEIEREIKLLRDGGFAKYIYEGFTPSDPQPPDKKDRILTLFSI